MPANVLLRLTDVRKSYETADGASVLTVLESVSLQIGRGESAAVTGPSGSGKSTLLNIIGGLDRPTAGRVMVDGEDIGRLDEKGLALFRNRKLGFVFQFHHLLPQCSALENVLIPALADASVPPPGTEDRAKKLLARVGLAERMNHRPGRLSGGERQRVAVVRALINRPSLILADEPTGALDRRAAAELGDLLLELNREENAALIVATHAPDLAARMGRRFELRDGKLTETAC